MVDSSRPFSNAASGSAEEMGIGAPVRLGVIVIAMFFGAFGAWAVLAPLDSAAIAPGVVSVDTKRKTVQHLEGGIVGEILVRDGDTVKASEVLIRLDETQPRASLALVQGRHRAALARQARLQMTELRTRVLNEVVQQLGEVQNELFDLSEKMRAAEDVLKRTVIRAPLDGTIVRLGVHTVGGVIAPGEHLLDIVPKDERLVIEARVAPQDIDVVEPGLTAQVRLTAFSQRSMLPISGQVVTISADRLTDERTGEDYFLAKVELVEDVAARLNGAALYPGMQAEVMIVTEARTFLDYLIRPMTQSFNRAFREI